MDLKPVMAKYPQPETPTISTSEKSIRVCIPRAFRETEKDGLEYIAGFSAFKFKTLDPSLGSKESAKKEDSGKAIVFATALLYFILFLAA